jgi:N-dimethylarginine dimethylaminohydrolase
MGAEQRAAEPRIAAQTLASLGVPILATPGGNATFEGADAIWISENRVMVGVGRRTNDAGFRCVQRVLGEMRVETVAVDIPACVQHLLGCVNIVDRDLAVSFHATPSALAVLAAAGIRVLDFPSDAETAVGRSLNFVTVAPREILMPAGCPDTRRRLEGEGVRCHELPIGEYLAAAGGIGCLTGVLWRG